MIYVNVENKIELYMPWEFKNCNFQYFFSKWIFSVIYDAKFTKFETCVVEGRTEGTVSQIFDLGLSYHFMQSRKNEDAKIGKKFPVFCHKMKSRT